MKRRLRNTRRGFTIIEVIVIVVILGVIAAVIAPRLLGRVGQSKRAVAQSNATALSTAMKLFANDHGMPEAGSSIMILWERPPNVEESAWSPYVDNADALKDPWGNLFVLEIPGNVNVDFDIVSYGKDGQKGGDGENEDVIAGKR
jgi:general secretion pathway protein G